MENEFIKLGVAPDIVKSIDEMGFKTPTLVQEKSIPHILRKEDLIVMSKTGSGKTGAFGIPMLQQVTADGNGPQGLVLTPTRELAVQVDSDLKNMSKYLDIKTTAVYGQHNMNTEINALKSGVAVVTGTPGRVFDHIQRHTFNTKNIKFLILDEADRMLDMGFIDQVFKIVKTIPRQRVTMMFSATMPTEIKRLSQSYMNNPTVIELESDTKTVDSTRQEYYRVTANEKRTQLDRLLKFEQPDSCLIFCNTRYEVDKVTAYLARKRYFVRSMHGANSQNSRIKTIEQIKKGEVQIVVATDVAARGLHIEDLNLVVNYDVPMEKDSYVHRIGRTGRAGKEGKAISIVHTDDLMSLYEIEEHVGALIEEMELPTDIQVDEAVANSTGKWAGKQAPKPKEHIPRPTNNKPHKPRQSYSKTGATTSNRPYAQKPSGNKPYAQKPSGNKPYAQKPSGNKPYAQKPSSNSPYAQKPTTNKPYSQNHKPTKPANQNTAKPQGSRTGANKTHKAIANKQYRPTANRLYKQNPNPQYGPKANRAKETAKPVEKVSLLKKLKKIVKRK